ncbi:MAG: hypothetical protein KDK45_17665, partial [Leptospiraceae bacterium]|nr:hypothetical protein [Leptospiraceae bacterium]
NILNKEIQPVRSPFEKKVEIRAKVLTEPRVALSSASVNTLSESTPPSDIPAPKSGTELKMEEIESGFSSVVRCKTVLSPVSGIEFSRLREGQEILITLPYKTDQEKIWANRLGAVGEDGIVHPLIVKFYRYIEMSKGEYYIYAKGPENVLLKAFEERKVRIAVPKDKKTALFEDVSDKLQLNWIFFVSIAGLLLTIGMIILYLSKYS